MAAGTGPFRGTAAGPPAVTVRRRPDNGSLASAASGHAREPGDKPVPRAVVTGGAGFLGSHLCERLLADGYDVVALDNFLTSSPGNVEHLRSHPGFRLVQCDVTDYLVVDGDVDVV